jgi:preprotein translocase subunit Sec63
MAKIRKYLYGIIGLANKESFGNIGIRNSEVYTIQYRDVAALVSDIPENYEIDLEEARTHEKTLTKVMETRTVIPIGFGVIAKNEDYIRNMLKRARMKFKIALENMNDKLQINVKILWDKAVLASILDEHEEIRKLSREVKENGGLSLRIELGRKVKSALDERKSEYLENIQCALKDLSDGFKENRAIDQDTLLNASFLVLKNREQEFYSILEELGKKYEKKLQFLNTCPLPPFNFMNILMKRIDFNTLKEARKTLGLEEEISMSEIDSAYNLLARKYHPDLLPDDPSAEERFKKIKNAHELLAKYCEHYLCSLEKTKVEETILVQEKD